MRKFAILLTTIALTACDKPTIVVSHVDTFCTSVDRFHATEAQRAAFKANETLWETAVNYLAGISKKWDAECLKPPATSR